MYNVCVCEFLDWLWLILDYVKYPSQHTVTKTLYLPETASPQELEACRGHKGSAVDGDTQERKKERKCLDSIFPFKGGYSVYNNIIRGHQETVLKAIWDIKKVKWDGWVHLLLSHKRLLKRTFKHIAAITSLSGPRESCSTEIVLFPR